MLLVFYFKIPYLILPFIGFLTIGCWCIFWKIFISDCKSSNIKLTYTKPFTSSNCNCLFKNLLTTQKKTRNSLILKHNYHSSKIKKLPEWLNIVVDIIKKVPDITYSIPSSNSSGHNILPIFYLIIVL
jgi:hypothetical protein